MPRLSLSFQADKCICRRSWWKRTPRSWSFWDRRSISSLNRNGASVAIYRRRWYHILADSGQDNWLAGLSSSGDNVFRTWRFLVQTGGACSRSFESARPDAQHSLFYDTRHLVSIHRPEGCIPSRRHSGVGLDVSVLPCGRQPSPAISSS